MRHSFCRPLGSLAALLAALLLPPLVPLCQSLLLPPKLGYAPRRVRFAQKLEHLQELSADKVKLFR